MGKLAGTFKVFQVLSGPLSLYPVSKPGLISVSFKVLASAILEAAPRVSLSRSGCVSPLSRPTRLFYSRVGIVTPEVLRFGRVEVNRTKWG